MKMVGNLGVSVAARVLVCLFLSVSVASVGMGLEPIALEKTVTKLGGWAGERVTVAPKKITEEMEKKIKANESRAFSVPPDRRTTLANGVRGSVLKAITDLEIFRRDDLKPILFLPGFGTRMEAGLPEAPSTIIQLRLAQKKKYRSTSFSTRWVDVSEAVDLPSAPSLLTIQSTPVTHVGGGEDTPPARPEMQKDEFFPREPVDILHIGTFRGAQIVSLRLSPVQYNPVQKKIRYHYAINYEISYE